MRVPDLPKQPEFRAFPSFRMPDSRFPLHLVNLALKARRISHHWGEAVSVTRHLVQSEDGAPIPVLEITPKHVKPVNRTIIYFHGGAFCFTYDRRHLQKVAYYAIAAKARVFFVDYRLSVTYPFPVPFEDCYQATLWVYRHADRLKVKRKQIIAMGDSAGGALATCVIQKVTDNSVFRPLGQCLIYPVIDATCSSLSARSFVDALLWTPHNNKRMWEIYLAAIEGADVPKYASPLHHPDLSHMPPTYIEAAALDPLRDEAIAYAEALKAAEVAVEFNLIEDAVHGFDFARFCTPIKTAQERRVAFLNKLFDCGLGKN